MKKIIFGCLLAIPFSMQAQVTTIVDGFSTNLTKNDLNFSGDRKVYAIGMNDRNSENYIVVSKNAKGSKDDHLYIEKFTKTGNGFRRTFSKEFTHPINLSLAFVNNRMTYSDVDKDGNVEFLYVVDAYDNGVDSNLETVYGVGVYNNKAYVLSATSKNQFRDTNIDADFAKLPPAIRDYFLNYWNKMSKD